MIASVLRKNLRQIVASYRKATGTTLSQVSKRFYGNASFLEAFFAGEQSISLNKFDEMLAQIAAAWPDGAEWPYCRAVIIPSPTKR